MAPPHSCTSCNSTLRPHAPCIKTLFLCGRATISILLSVDLSHHQRQRPHVLPKAFEHSNPAKNTPPYNTETHKHQMRNLGNQLHHKSHVSRLLRLDPIWSFSAFPDHAVTAHANDSTCYPPYHGGKRVAPAVDEAPQEQRRDLVEHGEYVGQFEHDERAVEVGVWRESGLKRGSNVGYLKTSQHQHQQQQLKNIRTLKRRRGWTVLVVPSSIRNISCSHIEATESSPHARKEEKKRYIFAACHVTTEL